MARMITFGRSSLLCTLLLLSLQACLGSVTVKVTPKVEVLKGDSASLPCLFTASPSSSSNTVEWFIEELDTRKRVAWRTEGGEGKSDKDTPLSDRVTMGQDFSLTIAPVNPEDQRSFVCQVTAGPGGVGEAVTAVTVFYAPEKPELTRPSSQAISVGKTTSSEIGQCTSKNGHPQPRIIWFKDDHPLPEVKDIKEKTYMLSSVVREASGLFTITSTLYMQPAKEDKDALFHCTVEYSMPQEHIKQEQSDTIAINLNYPSESATFTLVNTGPIKEGDKVAMKCETDGNPQPEFDFTKDGSAISGIGGLLELKSVKRSDAGVYMCKATDFDNMDADLTGQVTLVVHYIDKLSVSPAGPLSAMLGDMVELQCKTKASDPHTVQWKKGAEVLSQTGVLSLKSASFSDAGEYLCVSAVPSVPGLTASARLNLTVSGKPAIDVPVDGTVEKEGDMVTLSCSAHGHPSPQFTWTPSGEESVSVSGNTAVSTLKLKATMEVMKDGVTCKASNTHGDETKAFAVSIKAGKGRLPLVSDDASNNADRASHNAADRQQGGSSGVVVAVVICVLLLLVVVALLYFLSKKGKLPCGKKDQKAVASGEVNNDIVVEMKTEKANEEAGLLNKRPAPEQGSSTPSDGTPGHAQHLHMTWRR
ncbi:basal cell adhesion molecule [Aplochiton taeniatus]